jgi:hypothetical protein
LPSSAKILLNEFASETSMHGVKNVAHRQRSKVGR